MKILLQAIKSLIRGAEARIINWTNTLVNDTANNLTSNLETYGTNLTNNITEEVEERLTGKLDAENPVAKTSFSLGRQGEVGYASFAAGRSIIASGDGSHAEGTNAYAKGENSHAEGYWTAANGWCSHAEGRDTTAGGANSHAEGFGTETIGSNSHAEGWETIAKGVCSHAEGYWTVAGEYQHVQGKFNVEDTANKYAHIVGNGKNEDARSNAHTLDWDGNAWYQGRIKVGGAGWDDATDEVAYKSDLEGLGGGGGGSSNEVSTSTATNITGILKGNGSKVAAAVAGTDYAAANHTHSIANVNNLQSALNAKQAAPNTVTALPSSGTALAANTIYNVSAAVGTYAFAAPATGWAHGKFTTGASASVSFAGTFLGAAPTIEASKTYEFDVYNGVWAVQEVVSA